MIALPKLQSNRDLQEEKDKKEVIFKSSQRLSYDKEENFRIHHIVRNARENCEVGTPSTIPSRSNGMQARAQLTPLRNDFEKSAQLVSNNAMDDRKRKDVRLDPIQF